MAQRNVTANNGAIRASLIIIATLFLLAVVYYASAIFAPLLLAHWTQTFMGGAAGFIAQFFLLGALFGKLMDDCGAVSSIAETMSNWLGRERAILAVVLAGALVTFGGVSLFVAFFVLAPMAKTLFQHAAIPRRLMPAAIRARHLDLHHVGDARHAVDPERDPNAVFRHDHLRSTRPRPDSLRHHAWLRPVVAPRAERLARLAGEHAGVDLGLSAMPILEDQALRERATVSGAFDPAEIPHGHHADPGPPFWLAVLPLAVVISVNFLMSIVVLPGIDTSYLAEERFGATALPAVGGVWAVVVGLAAAIIVLVATNWERLPALRESVDAGANASVLPALSVASLVGFGAVVAALPAFAVVRDAVLSIGGGPLVSLALATNVLAALTGSASGGLIIALEALGETYVQLAAEQGIDPALMHRVAVIGGSTNTRTSSSTPMKSR